MNLHDIKKYLKEKELFQSPHIEKLGIGNNYQVFCIEQSGQRYTFRVKRDDAPVNDFLSREYLNLKFLEECGIDFAPRPIFFDAQKGVLILTYIGGRSVGVNDLNRRQIEDFVSKLNILHRLDYNEYKKFCRRHGAEAVKPMTPKEHLKSSGLDRFDYINQYCQRRDLIDWIGPRLSVNQKIVQVTPFDKKDIIFCHGDLAGANIFIDLGKLFFIDWDKAKFLYNTDYYLNYMFIHGQVSPGRQKLIIDAYARENKINSDDLRRKIENRMRITKLNDVIWAVMMYVKAIQEKQGNPIEYLNIAVRRMQEFDGLK